VEKVVVSLIKTLICKCVKVDGIDEKETLAAPPAPTV
jgi:hypothetical protein